MLSDEQVRVSMDSPSKLKDWLQATDRKWLLINSIDLVDALPWPEGVNTFQRILDQYREYRRNKPTGETTWVEDLTGKDIEVVCMATEVLTAKEKLALYGQLQKELQASGSI